MTPVEILILVGGGLAAGVVNTLAGGGSILTVPLLVLVGLPAGVANGTNRVGLILQNATAAWRFRAEGVARLREALPVLIPVSLGSVLGAALISQASDTLFSRLFGVVMLLLLIPTLRRPPSAEQLEAARPVGEQRPWLRTLLLLGIGLYGGALQAGVGILLLLVLSASGYDLLRANALKVTTVLAMTTAAAVVFLYNGQIAWAPALLLGAGFAAGGELGARLAIAGGEGLIRAVLAVSVLGLAGRMLGLY